MPALRALLVVTGAALAALAVVAPAAGCELALLLAIDVSGSVDAGEYRFQVDGTADALADPEVAQALMQGQVALAVVQWSASGMQTVTLPWQVMDSPAAIAGFATAARAQSRAYLRADTAVGDAIRFAAAAFDHAPACHRKVIDISGDGVQNAGGPLPEARQQVIAQGITLNAIAIEGLGVAITEFYLHNVVTRDGFVLTARGFSDYPRSIRAKLLREIVVPTG